MNAISILINERTVATVKYVSKKQLNFQTYCDVYTHRWAMDRLVDKHIPATHVHAKIGYPLLGNGA
jgi:hypothetical protein